MSIQNKRRTDRLVLTLWLPGDISLALLRWGWNHLEHQDVSLPCSSQSQILCLKITTFFLPRASTLTIPTNITPLPIYAMNCISSIVRGCGAGCIQVGGGEEAIEPGLQWPYAPSGSPRRTGHWADSLRFESVCRALRRLGGDIIPFLRCWCFGWKFSRW